MALSAAQKAKVQQILNEHKQMIADALTAKARAAYSDAFLRVDRQLGLKTSPDVVNEQAMQQAKIYGDLLKSEGASIINGEKLPWLADRTTLERSTITDIIEKGLAEGKYPGVKEGKGGYAKGTIAADLQGYFGERKSQATAVARTETGRILNQGQLTRYQDRGVSKVKVLDDEGPGSCAACGAVNGAIWTVEYAMEHELEHPNCLIYPNTPIYTSEGWKAVNKIVEGDLVLTHMGRFRRVTALMHSITEEPTESIHLHVWRATTNRRSVAVTPDHPILLNGKWTRAGDAKAGDSIRILGAKCAGCGTPIGWWHNAEAAYEIERQRFLEVQGYTVLHFPGKTILNDLASCSAEIDRVLANHEHLYEFIDMEVREVEHRPLRKGYRVYNLSVEEDESYIARGFVVHNCVRAFVGVRE